MGPPRRLKNLFGNSLGSVILMLTRGIRQQRKNLRVLTKLTIFSPMKLSVLNTIAVFLAKANVVLLVPNLDPLVMATITVVTKGIASFGGSKTTTLGGQNGLK